MNWLVIGLAIITAIIAYFLNVYIRKMSQVFKVLQDIEANTRAIAGTAAVQRLTPQQWPTISAVHRGDVPPVRV